MIKVGIIGTRGIPNNYGGFERFVEVLVGESIWKDEVHFIIFGEENSCDHSKNSGYSYIALNRKKSAGIGYYFESIAKAVFRCDIILCCGVGISVAAFIPKMCGRKLIINPDGCEWRRTKWSLLGRILIKLMYYPALLFADKIVIDAEALRNDFGKRFSSKSLYIPYQAIPPRLPGLSEGGLVPGVQLDLSDSFVAVIARLEPENNIAMICDAFVASNRPELSLIIVGNTDTDHFLESLKPSYGQTKNIKFVGGIYDQDLLNDIRDKALAYAHGHTVGGTNPSLLEALIACKGTLICHDNKYNREVAHNYAQYFSNKAQLSELFVKLPKKQVTKINNWFDERYVPAVIAKQYYGLFWLLANGETLHEL